MKRQLLMLGLAVSAFAIAYATTTALKTTAKRTEGMVWIPGGEFTMGTDSALGWPDEKPAHRVRVGGFWMDTTEVTNAQFQKFVEATGYVTTAEKPPDVEEILKQSPPGTPRPPAEMLVPGSLVFHPTKAAVKLDDFSQWWEWTPGEGGPGDVSYSPQNKPAQSELRRWFESLRAREMPAGPVYSP